MDRAEEDDNLRLCSGALKITAVGKRRLPGMPFKLADEIAGIQKAALFGNLRHRKVCGAKQHSGCV